MSEHPARQLRDPGFADPVATQRMVRLIRLRTALRGIVASSSALLELTEKGGEPDGCALSPFSEQRSALHPSEFKGRIEGDLVDGSRGENLREDELLEGVDLILQLLDLLCTGLGHGLFSIRDVEQAMPGDPSGHRLCEPAE